jgi:D-serine deaminase-like pyridoxal phosphate-dependent protein
MQIEEVKTPSLFARYRARTKKRRADERGCLSVTTSVSVHISKTHKCIEVAKIQTAGHDGAITVFDAGRSALPLRSTVSTTSRTPYLTKREVLDDSIEILKSGVKLNLLTDDAATVQALDEAAGKAGVKFDVFLKIDCGTHRVGVEPDTNEAVEIPRKISDSSNLTFAGILTHRRDIPTTSKPKSRSSRSRGTNVMLWPH